MVKLTFTVVTPGEVMAIFPLVLVAEAFALTYIGVAAMFPLPFGEILKVVV